MADYSGAYESPQPTARDYLSDVEKQALKNAFEASQERLALAQAEHQYALEQLQKAEQFLKEAEDAQRQLLKWAHG